MVTRGFEGRPRGAGDAERLPPGQHEARDFPILQIGPTPAIDLARWSFTIWDAVRPLKRWTWGEFQQLPRTRWRGDIHCVTTWSKLGTAWSGVSVDDLLAAAGTPAPKPHLLALGYDDYSTNLATADVVDGRALVATHYDGKPLTPDHGGPARLLVPHLYFWKSAKWCKGLRFTNREEAGLWELNGYHMRGDPWREERFAGD